MISQSSRPWIPRLGGNQPEVRPASTGGTRRRVGQGRTILLVIGKAGGWNSAPPRLPVAFSFDESRPPFVTTQGTAGDSCNGRGLAGDGQGRADVQSDSRRRSSRVDLRIPHRAERGEPAERPPRWPGFRTRAAAEANPVTELLHLDLRRRPGTGLGIAQPRNSWVFFSVPQEAKGAAARSGWRSTAQREQGDSPPPRASRRRSDAPPGRRDPPYGGLAEHDAAGVLTVRAIPESSSSISPATCVAGRFAVQAIRRRRHGRDRLFLYYWDWLDGRILKNVNVIQGGSKDNPFMPAWLNKADERSLAVTSSQRIPLNYRHGGRMVSGRHSPA